MRSPPAFQVTISHFGLWHGAVVLLILFTAAVGASWLIATAPNVSVWGMAACGAVLLVLLLGAKGLVPAPAVSLRWDGQCWHLGLVSAVGIEPWQGRIDVCMDLGFWMLLCFRTDAPGFRAHRHWLPIQRSGLRNHWHALRCAVYSPPLDGSPTAAIDPRPDE